MNLIVCSECGKSVQPVCSNCGCPLDNTSKRKNNLIFIGAIIVLIILIGIMVFLLVKSDNKIVGSYKSLNININRIELQEITNNTRRKDIEALIYLSDKKAIEFLYSNKVKEFEEEAENYVKNIEKQYKETLDGDVDKEKKFLEYLSIYGYDNLDELKDAWILNEYYRLITENYVKKIINEDELKDNFDRNHPFYSEENDYSDTKYEEVKDKVLEDLVRERLNEDQTLYSKALKSFREKNNFTIYDDDLKLKYEKYMENLLEQEDGK